MRGIEMKRERGIMGMLEENGKGAGVTWLGGIGISEVGLICWHCEEGFL